MRWVCAWKKVDGSHEKQAKARLVVKGFTDPDLIKIRAESPTLSKVGRNCLLQLAASCKLTLSMGDVKTAFLQGNLGDSERDIYGDLPPDARRLFKLSDDGVIKLEGSVYGLRTAPKAWFSKVATDLKRSAQFNIPWISVSSCSLEHHLPTELRDCLVPSESMLMTFSSPNPTVLNGRSL